MSVEGVTPKISEVSKECIQHKELPESRVILSVHVVCHPGESPQFWIADILQGALAIHRKDLDDLEECLEEAYCLQEDHSEEFVHVVRVEESGEWASFPAWDSYFVVTSFEDVGFGVEISSDRQRRIDALEASRAEVASLRIQNSGLMAQNLSIRDEVAAIRAQLADAHDRLNDEYNRGMHDAQDALQTEVAALRRQVEERCDVVTVPREEWEALNEFADHIVPVRDNLSGISWTGRLSDVFEAYDKWYAFRINQDDALRSGEAGKGAG